MIASAMNPEQYIDALYRLCLGHPPDEAGLAAWCEHLKGQGDPTLLLAQLLDSDGYRERMTAVRGIDILLLTPDLIRMDDRQRAMMTASCRDTDYIPKVELAGEVIEYQGQQVQVMHNGILVKAGAYYGDWMTPLITSLRGHHEPQEEKAFYEILKTLRPGASMIELGSYWCYYSLWFQTAISGARNICCEPDLANLKIGQLNARLNGKELLFYHAAAGQVDGQTTLFVSESGVSYEDVPIRTVDSLLDTHGWNELDILHIDIQGAELSALKGAARSFSEGRIRYVFVSTHHYAASGSPTTHQQCVSFLKDAGARIVCSHTVAESYSGDGLIVASFEPESEMSVEISRNHTDASMFRPYEEDIEILLGARSITSGYPS